jgi:hypothetical protein
VGTCIITADYARRGSDFLVVNKCRGSSHVVVDMYVRKKVTMPEGKARDVVDNNRECTQSGASVAKTVEPGADLHSSYIFVLLTLPHAMPVIW